MTIQEILNFFDSMNIEYTFLGNKQTEVSGFSSLKNYKQNTFTWAKNELAYDYNFKDKLLVIVQEGLDIQAQNVIVTTQSKLAFFSLIEYVADNHSEYIQPVGIGSVIGKDVRLGKNVIIGNNCVLEGKIVVGDNTRIWHNVVILNNVNIGQDSEIQSGCVIGHDGFAWNEDADKCKTMIKHFGGVDIGNHVYMGPNVVVDRGEIDHTRIEDGVKIDANCFIAHNVIIKRNAILITGSKLYGSSELGEDAYVASATVRNQCKIGNHSFIGMGAVVTHDIPDNVTVVGVPAHIVNK